MKDKKKLIARLLVCATILTSIIGGCFGTLITCVVACGIYTVASVILWGIGEWKMEDKFKDTKGLDKAYMSLAKHYDEHKENVIRQVKDGAFVDLLNNEIEELQKSSAIEVIAQTMCKFSHSSGKCDCGNRFAPNCTWKDMATSVYNAGYRKIPEDSVVLSKEEYNKLKAEIKKLNDDASASTNIEDLTPLANMLKEEDE